MENPSTVYSISEINRYIKSVLINDSNLKWIRVKGEVSNFKVYPSGHIYFSLKDKESVISAVMFANYAAKLLSPIKNGDEVVVLASIDVYPPRGGYQLMIYEMNPFGLGAQLIELEKLKKKLLAEGLFDESRKREIDLYPKSVGVITAKNGAAVKDIVTNIRRRYPLCDIFVFPSSVQGENAPKELLHAFELSQRFDLTTLIIGRGGGASEDLNAFNDEALVRAISTSKCPVISAVGHEIDTTLVDYVADKRASTPTGAAELATVDLREIENYFILSIDKMNQSLNDKMATMKERIDNYRKTIKKDLMDQLIQYKNDLEKEKSDLNRGILNKINDNKKDIEYYKKHLDAIHPNRLLDRGYAYVSSDKGEIISSIDEVSINDVIHVTLKNGALLASVKEKKNGI